MAAVTKQAFVEESGFSSPLELPWDLVAASLPLRSRSLGHLTRQGAIGISVEVAMILVYIFRNPSRGICSEMHCPFVIWEPMSSNIWKQAKSLFELD